MSVLDAAYEVLRGGDKPLHYEEITRRLLERGLWDPRTKTPARTVGAEIYTDIKRRGDASRFRRVARGTFAVSRSAEEQTAPRPETPSAGSPDEAATLARGLSFGDAAEQVLERSADRQPMHYRDLARRAIELGLIASQGQTPEATLRAQIGVEIQRQEQRGERPRFFRLPKGLIGLTRWKSKDDLASQIERHNLEVRKKLHDRLMVLQPAEFEVLVSELLVKLGFEATVTKPTGDGGIDVRGTLVVGDVIRTRMAVQVKRWKGNVQAPTVQQVRGSLGAHEQGLIVTTSDFSPGAVTEAARLDATPVALMNGEEFVRLLMQNQIGVRRAPQELFELAETDEPAGGAEEEVEPAGKSVAPTVSKPAAVSLAVLRAGGPGAVTGRKPAVVIFPDGSQAALDTWQGLAIQMVTWLGKQSKLPPLPFPRGGAGKRYLLNTTPDHKTEPMAYYATIQVGAQTIYLHTKRSALEFVANLADLCDAAGQPASEILVSVL